MAEAINFAGANAVLKAPIGHEETVSSLHTFTNGFCSVSCWKLDPEELQEIQRTGHVFLSVVSGSTQPPVFPGSETAVRGVVVDYGGVWKRGKV